MTEKRKKSRVKVFTSKQKTSKPENEYIEELRAKYNEKVDLSKIKSFKDFPLSFKTSKGLRDAGYKVPTEIQKQAIMLGLKGNDILGAAQTGSGKTLAFLIPMLEQLFCKQWTHLDGLGALIITPTRELALQIFETLKKIGGSHDFSAGLIIGGKDLKFERKRMDQCNIIICTPGRLLQHMDENPLFDACNLQILILDEADRCMDMGFKATMNAIIANLPLERQTLLFSATQTKSVKDLARLNLKNPSYISVHEHAEHSTPDKLEQGYCVCELKDKVAVLWTFIKSHLKKKTIVFFSTCKQVKFYFEVFSKMRPGVPLIALYGRMHQLKRIKVYEEFTKKSAAVLFATDIVARGLDFPEVDWVFQVDCPEDAETYIHRVGRTARFFKGGESRLLLMPSELEMLKDLEKKKIPIKRVKILPADIKDPFSKVEAFVADDTDLQFTAKRAFVTYLKSIFMMKKRKDIFNIEALDFDSFARSYGLTATPRLNFLKKDKGKKAITAKSVPSNPNKIIFDDDGNPLNKDFQMKVDKNDEKPMINEQKIKKEMVQEDKATDDSDSDSEIEFGKNDFGKSLNKSLKNVQHIVISEVKHEPISEEDLRLLNEQEVPINKKKPTTKIALAKKMLKDKSVISKVIKFDEEGDPIGKNTNSGDGLLIDKLEEKFKEIDELNKQAHREKVKAKHKEQKRKLKEQKKREKEGENVDDFGESESEDDIDLSWIPDPKKIYGDKGEQDSGDEDSEHSGEDDSEHSGEDDSEHSDEDDFEELNRKKMTLKDKKRRGTSEKVDDESKNKRKLEESKGTLKDKKRKRNTEDIDGSLKKKHKTINKIKEMTSELTVNEAEELALMLLQK